MADVRYEKRDARSELCERERAVIHSNRVFRKMANDDYAYTRRERRGIPARENVELWICTSKDRLAGRQLRAKAYLNSMLQNFFASSKTARAFSTSLIFSFALHSPFVIFAA